MIDRQLLPCAAKPGGRSRVLLTCIILFFSGCGSYVPVMTPFGAVASPDHNRSLNGLGLHRKIWESAGVKCITPQKLSPRLSDVDTIVLVGQSHAPPGIEARKWLESWLAEEEGRTVVYFGRDFNAENYYRTKTLSQLSDEKQLAGKIANAKLESQELSERIRMFEESTFCRWFYLDTTSRRKTLTNFTGPWAAELSGEPAEWAVSVTLRPPDEQDWITKTPSWLKPGAVAKPAAINFQFSAGSSDSLVRRSVWENGELDTKEKWNEQFNDVPESNILLAGDDGTPLVFRLSGKPIAGSQIIIVTNGAPFLNGTLVEPFYRKLSSKIIESCLPGERVAMFAYSQSGILISDAPEQNPRGAGLELFLVWPLSGLTVPLALMGVIACVALLPIMGRPQRGEQRSVSDFGMHVDAMGHLLSESQDWGYCSWLVECYFRRVRRETPPDWVQELQETHQATSVTLLNTIGGKPKSVDKTVTGSIPTSPTTENRPTTEASNNQAAATTESDYDIVEATLAADSRSPEIGGEPNTTDPKTTHPGTRQSAPQADLASSPPDVTQPPDGAFPDDTTKP